MKLSSPLALSIILLTTALPSHALVFSPGFTPEIKARVLSDLNFIKNIQADQTSPFHQKIFGTPKGRAVGTLYSRWFNTRITTISPRSCGGIETAVACVMPIFMGPHEMGVTKNYINVSSPQVARISILFHEARHTERNDPAPGAKDERYWLHAQCPTPFLDETGNERMSIWTGAPLSGKEGCDTNPLGAYGTASILLKNIAQNCRNCSEKEKADAELYAHDQMKRIIDVEAQTQLLND